MCMVVTVNVELVTKFSEVVYEFDHIEENTSDSSSIDQCIEI